MTENQINGSDVELAVQAEIVNGGIYLGTPRDRDEMTGIYREIYVRTKRLIDALPAMPVAIHGATMRRRAHLRLDAASYFEAHEPDVVVRAPVSGTVLSSTSSRSGRAGRLSRRHRDYGNVER
ncbi:hypothetical protein [Streptomyces sp. CBMA123]|uniref:hypothetical protein n=1 Tax=Streptomyces sp. CBMA123 TaxID=1896313 RepID=UPI0016620999|nr:hypothetical protein [Streptomyces sp. CBMA123]